MSNEKRTPTPWIYIRSEHTSEYSLYTVGFYDPDDKWQPESDHSSSEAAAQRIGFLNGGNSHDALVAALEAVDRWRIKGTRGDALPEPIADIVRAALKAAKGEA